jgi:hypothetical protein
MKKPIGLKNEGDVIKRTTELQKKEPNKKNIKSPSNRWLASLFQPVSANNVRLLSPKAHYHPHSGLPNGAPHETPSEEKRTIRVLVAETTIPGFLDVLLSLIHRHRSEFGNVMFSVVSVHDPSHFHHELMRNHQITFIEDLFLLQLKPALNERAEEIVLLTTALNVDHQAEKIDHQFSACALIMTDRVDLNEHNHSLLESHIVSVILKRIDIDATT